MTERRRRCAVLALAAIAVVPVVTAVARVLRDGWYPVGDQAFYPLRARDVLTEHHPLIGTWSSASLAAGDDVNHPGPLYFDLLAIPVRVDAVRGTLVGIGLLAGAAIAGIVAAGWRRGGARTAAWAGAGAAALVWAMGSGMVADPWQPNVSLLPFLAFLVLVWALVKPDLLMLPWAVAAGSFAVQTHGSFLYVVPPIGAAALVVALVRARHDLRMAGSARRALVVAGVIALALWAQPLAEQVTSEGRGNLSRIAEAGPAGERSGVSLGVRMAGSVLAVPPAWLRPSLGDTFVTPGDEPVFPGAVPPEADVASGEAAIVGLATLGLVLTAAAVRAHRRRDTDARDAVMVAATAAIVAIVVTCLQSVSPILGIVAHQVLWLWPVAVFVAVAVLLAAVPRGRLSLSGGLALAVVLALLAIPARDPRFAWGQLGDAAPAARELGKQLDALDSAGTVLFDPSGLPFAEPYSTPVLLELQRHGIDFVVADDVLARQVGESRHDPKRAAARLTLRVGPSALDEESGHTRIALVDGLGERGRRELRRLERALRRDLVTHGLVLTEGGHAALARGRIPTLVGARGLPRVDDELAAELIATSDLARLVTAERIELPAGRRAMYERYAALVRRRDVLTVGAFLSPIRRGAER